MERKTHFKENIREDSKLRDRKRHKTLEPAMSRHNDTRVSSLMRATLTKHYRSDGEHTHQPLTRAPGRVWSREGSTPGLNL